MGETAEISHRGRDETSSYVPPNEVAGTQDETQGLKERMFDRLSKECLSGESRMFDRLSQQLVNN